MIMPIVFKECLPLEEMTFIDNNDASKKKKLESSRNKTAFYSPAARFILLQRLV